jgi:hypothetical protein
VREHYAVYNSRERIMSVADQWRTPRRRRKAVPVDGGRLGILGVVRIFVLDVAGSLAPVPRTSDGLEPTTVRNRTASQHGAEIQ